MTNALLIVIKQNQIATSGRKRLATVPSLSGHAIKMQKQKKIRKLAGRHTVNAKENNTFNT